MAIRVLTVSDHPLTRSGLRQMLKAALGFEIVAEADAPGPVGDFCRKFTPDVVVFEITAAGDAGPRVAAVVVKAALPARTVVLAGNENVHYARALLAAGVAAYILRKANPEDLMLAVRNAASGLRYIDPRLSDGLAEILLRGDGEKLSPRPGGLSRREAQVLRAVARGFTSREIGRQLRLSAKTVETYRCRIYEKLGLRTRADLVQYALAAGVLQEGESEVS